MLNVKQQVKEAIDQLPDDCSFEDVQYRLYVLETLKQHIDLADRGEFATDQEVDQRLSKWLAE